MTFVLKSLINNLGFLMFFAYILTRMRLFKDMATKSRSGWSEKLILSIVFGCIGVLATYSGTSVNGAIANSRTVGVLVGGIFGGPVVGLGAGLIAGVHRWAIDIGGFTSLACMLSTILGGMIGGLFSKLLRKQRLKWLYALLLGILAESLQMLLVLLLAKPFPQALELVKIIAVPMVIFNPIGIAMFVALIDGIFKEQEKEAAIQTQLALDIAERCLGYMRKGLNAQDSMQQVTRIIMEMSNVSAVTITNREHIIARAGIDEDQPLPGTPVLPELFTKVIETGLLAIAASKTDIGSENPDCKLRSAVIVPLTEKERVIGTLTIYRTRENGISVIDTRLAEGLAKLFSTQLELSSIDTHIKLREKAELKALQSQINPHFLFNTLNTIVFFCRTGPDKAKDLLIDLSTHLRNTLEFNADFVSLETELKHVNAFISIENARFEGLFTVDYTIEPGIDCLLPQLVLQPIVENAIMHGLKPANGGGKLSIAAKKGERFTHITIRDNGIGIDQGIVDRLYSCGLPDCKVGLSNVYSRLKVLYGKDSFRIARHPDGGTLAEFFIPNGTLNPCQMGGD